MIITHNFTQRSDMIQVTPTKSNRSLTMVTFPQNNYGDWYLADDNSTISYLGKRKMMDGCIILKWLTRLFMPYQENMLLVQISRQIHKCTIYTITHART